MSRDPRRARRRARRRALVPSLALAVGALGLLPACAGPWSSSEPGTGSAEEPAVVSDGPNVVVVLADDLGWSDLSTDRVDDSGAGRDVNQTPAIDELAREGTSFVEAYATPTCAPTRMSLLTGMYAPRPDNGVYAVTDLDRRDATLRDPVLRPPAQGRPDGSTVLPGRATTVAEALQGVGYATAYAGKFHVTRQPDDITRVHGFDANFGGGSAGGPDDYFAVTDPDDPDARTWNPAIDRSLDPWAGDYTEADVRDDVAPYSSGVDRADLDALVGTPKHVTDALTDATIDFIDDHAEGPFLTVVGEYAVHTPVGDDQARGDLLAKYRELGAGQPGVVPAYSALTEGLDQSVARIVDHLRTTPDPRNPGTTLDENTVVVVTSDNGGRTDVGADNGPLRGQKGEVLEGGIRVPWIAWSGDADLVQRGRIDRSLVDSPDLYATLADWAGVPDRPDAPLDGTSLAPTLATGERLDRPRFGHFPGYLIAAGRGQRPASWVRDGRWKATYDYEQQRLRLFDVRRDPGEADDLAAARPGRARELGEELVGWLADVGAPLATARPGHGTTIAVREGAWTYRDGRITRHDRAGTVPVPPGAELPLVLPPARGRG